MQHILFDLDGTLSDPMVGICSAVQHALRHFGIEVADIRTLTPFIGPPLEQSFRELYGLAPSQMAEAHQAYNEYYLARGMYENVPYDGMAALLARLRQAGKHLYVATSKPEPLARRILEHFGLIGYFSKKDLNRLWLWVGVFSMVVLLTAIVAPLTFFFYFSSSAYLIYDLIMSVVILVMVLVVSAIDSYNIKKILEAGQGGTNIELYCAFSMYSDFIAIFVRVLYLLLILGSRRSN